MGRPELHRILERREPSRGRRDLPDAREVVEPEVDSRPSIAQPPGGAARRVDPRGDVLGSDPVPVAVGDEPVAPSGGVSFEDESKAASLGDRAPPDGSNERLELARGSLGPRPLVDAREGRRRRPDQEPREGERGE